MLRPVPPRSWAWRAIGVTGGIALAITMGGCAVGDAQIEQTVDSGGVMEFDGTRTEFEQVIVDCLREAGYDAVLVDAGGGVPGVQINGVEDPVARRGALEQNTVCAEKMPPFPEPDTDAELAEFYETWMGTWQCLVDEGFDVDSAPSFQAFLDLYRAGEAESTPHGLLNEPPNRVFAAQELCPGFTDEWW